MFHFNNTSDTSKWLNGGVVSSLPIFHSFAPRTTHLLKKIYQNSLKYNCEGDFFSQLSGGMELIINGRNLLHIFFKDFDKILNKCAILGANVPLHYTSPLCSHSYISGRTVLYLDKYWNSSLPMLSYQTQILITVSKWK